MGPAEPSMAWRMLVCLDYWVPTGYSWSGINYMNLHPLAWFWRLS